MAAFDRWWRGTPRSWGPTWLWAGLVIVLFCAPLFHGLGDADVENDEAIYSFAVDVMLKSGDWLTPKSIPSETVAFLEKPPLKFWLVAAPIALGILPHNEFGQRFWDALFGSVAFLYVFAIGRRLGGPIAGALSVLMLFVHRELLFSHGLRNNNMEAPLFLAYCAGMYHFLAWRTAVGRAGRRWHVAALSLSFVLGFMTKFVAALFLPFTLVVAMAVTPQDWTRFRRDWRLWAGAGVLAAALITPWFAYQYFVLNPRVFDVMLGLHVVRRFTESLDPSHLHPWHHYFSSVAAALQEAGGAALTGIGAGLLLTRLFGSRCQTSGLLFLWFAVPLGLMSIGTSKLYHYAYPFLPPVAIAGGYAGAVLVDAVWSSFARPFKWIERAAAPLVAPTARWPRLRWALVAAAVGAAVLTVATYALGQVKITIADVVVLRNSSLLRPALIAAGAALLAGGTTFLRAAIVAAVAGLLIPVGAYRANLDRTSADTHPLRSVRDCLRTLATVTSGSAEAGPGVWVEAGSISHTYHYYLRDVGPWQQRTIESDATVVANLYAPDAYRPTLISTPRYDEIMRRVDARDPDLIEQTARKAQVDPSVLEAGMADAELGYLKYPGELLVLPGPYSACAPDRGGRSNR